LKRPASLPWKPTPRNGVTVRTAAAHDADTASEHLKIVVVDDHRFMREIISRMLSRHSDAYEVVAEAADVQSALAACEKLQPDLLILDINLPDQSGIEAVPQLQRIAQRMRILLCTAGVTDERIVDALRSGANGFVEKTNSWDDFIVAVERVAAGDHYFCSRSSAALAQYSQNGGRVGVKRDPRLTMREKEVLVLVARGDSSKEIANALGVSVGTVDVHRANLMKKLQVRNVAGLVLYAFEGGLIRSADR
jgi:DNA-binding NarL/FixJ family response regulator